MEFLVKARQFMSSHYIIATTLQVTPAISREENKECYVMGFYDYHDVWHFFSACGMFFAFLVSIATWNSRFLLLSI